MKLGHRVAVIAAAGGIVFAGLAGPAYADGGSCTGAVGQKVAHPEYFCNGLTVPPVHPSASDDEVQKVAVCALDFAVGSRLGGFSLPGLGLSTEECARSIIFGW